MSRFAYVDGAYVRGRDARVSAHDRGFLFGDGVYEVWRVEDGRLRDLDGHFARLKRSLAALRIAEPMPEPALRAVVEEVRRRNLVREGAVYLQVTRGAAVRDHVFPDPPVAPTLFVAARSSQLGARLKREREGVTVITAPDERWAHCDIKSVNLLPNVLAKQRAKERGAFECWLVDAEGRVTEGAASNAWIVTQDGVLVTAPLSANILAGITRTRLIATAQALQIPVQERRFSLEEAKAAREAFISSATNEAVSVIAIDGEAVGDGRPGPIARRLREGGGAL